ncbi:MAG TPA: cobyrinic acid a,c-diamide synthase, partial [Phycisphaerales bacterium]|nr:cobyrinic acid a,c-diamide synthase [Phycisphaerales bacterium]
FAGSLAAVVKGFVEFDRRVRVAGVIANRTGSQRHREVLDQALRAADLPPLVGAVPRGSLPTLTSRHLGLWTANEQTLSAAVVD